MSLVTINNLIPSISSNGEELLPAWQNNGTVSLPVSALNPYRGVNNTIIDQPNGTIISGCGSTLSGCNSECINTIIGAVSGAITGGRHNFIAGGLDNTIEDCQSNSVIIGSQSSCVNGLRLFWNSIAEEVVSRNGDSNSIINSRSSNISGSNFFNTIIASEGSNILSQNPHPVSASMSFSYGRNSSIIGGRQNTIYGHCNVIIGGACNKTGYCQGVVTSFYGANAVSIGGGPILDGTYPAAAGNRAENNWTVTIGGICNRASQPGSVIIGGESNITIDNATFSPTNAGFIIGGKGNTILGTHNNSSIINGTGMSTVSSDMLHTTRLYLSAGALPTSDPGVPGVVWNNSGALMISQ